MNTSLRALALPSLIVALLAACDNGGAGLGGLDVGGDGSGGDTTDNSDGGDGQSDADDAGDDAGDDSGDGGDTAGDTDADLPDADDIDGDDSGTDTDADAVADADADATDDARDAADADDSTGTDAATDATDDSSDTATDAVDPGDLGGDTLPDAGPVCGDGLRNGTEPCEGLDLGGADCVTQGYAGGLLACADCTFDTRGCTEADVCGDSIVGDTEQCDVGDAFDGDGCTSACQICTEDEGEPNDSFTQFEPIAYPSTGDYVAQTADADYFRLLLAPGCTLDGDVLFDVDGPALEVAVYTTTGELLAEGLATETGFGLTWADPTPGFSSQYVLIEVVSADAGGCVDYSVVIRARCG